MTLKWEGIEDTTTLRADPVWFARLRRDPEKAAAAATGSSATGSFESASTSKKKSGDEAWSPLRKTDCRALNQLETKKPIYIESGRSTADPIEGKIFYNFFRGPERELISALWFKREEEKDECFLYPIRDAVDEAAIETLYKRAVVADSKQGQGIDSLLNEEVHLRDGSKVMIKKSSNTISLQRTPPGWFASSQTLQRGYGKYTIAGEDEENQLGPVRYLFFVVHGIGETVFARDDVKIPSLIDQINVTRTEVEKRQVALWKEDCAIATKKNTTRPPPPFRIEFIPIEWWESVHGTSTELTKSLKAVTPQSIPALRTIANDIVFDVLLYLTPNFCTTVLESVTSSIQALMHAFKKIHPNFEANGGTTSLIGHSLGSVIVWDLLSILQEANQKTTSYSGLLVGSDSTGYGLQAPGKEQTASGVVNGTWGPSLTKKMEQTIPFTPEVTLLLGSPLGMFLTLRGAHEVFSAMRQEAVGEVAKLASLVEISKDSGAPMKVPQVSPFSLPTGSLYNILNLSDPVAYRVEPLLLPIDTSPDSIPPPPYLTAPGKDVRLHVKARQMTGKIRNSFKSMDSWGALIGTAVSALAPENNSSNGKITTESTEVKEGSIRFPLGGKSNRVDFSFQPGVIDNEYISAVLAHSTSTYFSNADFQEFLIRILESSHLNGTK